MRVLKFIVNRQRMSKDPNADFQNIVAGSVGYLYASFDMSSDWNGCMVVAHFTGDDKEDFMPVINGKCSIPDEVLTGRFFTVQLIGTSGDDFKIISTRELVLQKAR